MIRLVLCYPVRLYLQSSVLYFLYYLPFSLVRKACCVQPFCMCTSPLQCVLLAVFRFHIHNSLCSSVIYSACCVTATRRSCMCVCLWRNACPSVCRHGQPAGHHTRQGCERWASLLHQPPVANASRRAVERTTKHTCVHLAGSRPRYRP